jgi:hypothetical protein
MRTLRAHWQEKERVEKEKTFLSGWQQEMNNMMRGD